MYPLQLGELCFGLKLTILLTSPQRKLGLFIWLIRIDNWPRGDCMTLFTDVLLYKKKVKLPTMFIVQEFKII